MTKRAMSLQACAGELGLPVEGVRALVEAVLGEARDVLTAREFEVVRDTHTRALRGPVPSGVGQPAWTTRGQGVLDFGGKPERGAPWLRSVVSEARRQEAARLFATAVRAEEEPVKALGLYAQALAQNPHHADAHVNMGRLLHQQGAIREAEAHYTAALVARPGDPTATFNLAVVLQDLGRVDEAVARYREAIELDPACVDAYFNLARLYEKKGETAAAIRHLKDYRRLTDERP